METVYYHLNAARITIDGSRKASGGEELRCVVARKARRTAPAEGKVLDFEACRRALEEERVPMPAEEAPAGKKGLSPWLIADLCATVLVAACTVLAALGVLLG